MRLLPCFGVVFLLAFPLLAQAQPESGTASPQLITNALRGLNSKFNLVNDHYAVDINDRAFTLYRLEQGQRLLLRASVKGQASLATLNHYNERFAVTTRAVRHERAGVMLEVGVDASIGLSEAGLKKTISNFLRQVDSFENYLAKAAADGDNKKEPKIEPKVGTRPIRQQPPLQINPNSDDREFVVTFPTNDPQNWETAWKVIWDMESASKANEQGFKFGKGNAAKLFKIKQAYFKTNPKSPWVQVLDDAHPSEFYVPYYFKGTRFYDLKSVGGYTTLSAKEGGAISQTLGKSRLVMAELRDTGVAYKHGSITRRSEELTLWANFGAANYTYMVEYGFRDDGGIVFRHSPTGYNYYAHFDASHMHGSFWRVGMKLGPEGNNTKNTVHVVSLPRSPKEQGDGGRILIEDVTKESFHDWSPEAFTRIRVTNSDYSVVPAAKDRPALPISYDLITYPQGIARHRRFKDENFSLHDFWITRHDCPEKMYVNLGNHFFTPNGQPNPRLADLNQENVVLWHSSAGLHVPRAEDGIVAGNSTANGQATVYWTVFELRPRNMFLRTPIYRSLP